MRLGMKLKAAKLFTRVVILSASLFILFLPVGQANKAHAAVEPFIGEIMWVGYNFCPRGWTEASGQLLAISGNEALFSLYGTQFGGDGRTTFALPDLRGRVSLHAGTGPGLSPYNMGQRGGAQSNTLSTQHLPSHSHGLNAAQGKVVSNVNGGDSAAPEGRLLADGQRAAIYADVPALAVDRVEMADESVSLSGTTDAAGNGNPVENRQPYTVLRACVALQGTFPSRS